MQHMKAAAGTEASTTERHTELAYEGGGRLRAPALRNTPFALELSKKNRMEMLKASYTGWQRCCSSANCSPSLTM